MSGWNEDDFLEAMMPVLRKKQGPDWCPDAETLGAVAEGNVSDALKEAIAAHTAACSSCAGLQERLRRFDQASFVHQDAAWQSTEKRLDDWMDSVFAANRENRIPERPRRAKTPGWRERVSHLFTDWRMQVAMGAAAALMFVFAVQLVRREHAAPVQIAARATPAERPPTGVPAPSAEGAKRTPPVSAQGHAVPPEPRAKTADVAKKAPLPSEQPAAAPAAPIKEETQATELAKDVQPPAASPASPPANAAPPAMASPTAASEPVQVARSNAPPATAGSPRRLANTVPAGAIVRAPAGPNRALALRASGRALPAEIKIDAGTRIWVMLKSIDNNGDGTFGFRGMVLLPVMQAGAVLLDRGTEVQGSGKTAQGRTTVQISGFSVGGAHYGLKNAAGGTSAQAPGAGGAVQFDAGQVLEMWMGSGSAYEKAENGPPQK